MNINPTKTVNELVTVLPYIIDIDERKKIYHSWRVAILSAVFAKSSANANSLKQIFYAALLHDIGGVGFPIHMIHYLKRNDKSSRNILLSHPIIGAQLVSGIPRMEVISKLILDHHEWINGMGYPRAKIARDIPWGSQIIRIADTIDIRIQSSKLKSLSELRDKMLPNINFEYSKATFDLAFDALKKNRLLYKIIPAKNVPAIFKDIHDDIGSIHIASKIDAIGKTLEVVAQIIDMKHPFTAGHSLRVSRYAMAIALAMGMAHDDITYIRWAGLIHDIGKLNVSRRILDKPGSLTTREYREIQKHALQTYKILNLITTLQEITPLAAAHHERFDGTGYPFGLKKEEIPIGARILAICDTFDAMTSNRPYRRPLTFEEACIQIKHEAGKQFDPEIVEQALPLLKNLGF